MRFVHAADLHLDSPMQGLSAYPGAPAEAMRGATRLAFEGLIDLCVEREADFLLIAGDVYDGDWKDFGTGLYLRAQLTRMRDAGIPVVIIRGNHDAASVITKALRLPEGTHVLGHTRPERVALEDAGVVVHGQSFATRAVTENLAAGYPKAVPGLFNIGLLHTCLGGYAEHEGYAPCALDQLVGHGYDYWALGHVHERAVLHAGPAIVFPGNLQGRHVRESGPKGATVVDVDVADGDVTLTHHDLDHVRWTRVPVDAAAAGDDVEVLERAELALRDAVAGAGGRLVASRIEVAGITTAHDRLVRGRERLDAELRALATDLGAERVWVERVTWRTAAPRSGRARDDDAVGETLKVLRETAEDPAALAALAEALRPLAVKLPPELRDGADGIDPTDPATLRALLRTVERTLPSLLLEGTAA